MKFAVLAFVLLSSRMIGEGMGRQRVDMIVPLSCIHKPIHFIDCDVSGPNDKCKSMEPLDFHRACAQILIVREK